MVVDDGPDADELVVGKTGFPDDARILEAWYDEHDLRNSWWEQVVGGLFACIFDDHPMRDFGGGLGVFMLRVGGSLPGWF